MTDFAEAGDFAVDTETRSIRGLLMPWAEITNPEHSKPTRFARGDLKVPNDVSALNANRLHNRLDPVGRFTAVEDTERGLIADFSIARNPEGDELLADIKAGRLTKLSAEVRNIVRTGVDATAELVGAAFVPRGAFESAAVFALDAAPTDEDLTRALEVLAAVIAERTAETSEPAPAVEDAPPTTEPEAPATEPKEDDVPEAVAPNTIEPTDDKKKVTAEGLFALISSARRTGDREALAAIAEAEAGDFALTDVKTSGASQLGTNVIQAGWLGDVWNGNAYERRIIPLVQHADLTSFEVKGWAFSTEPTVAAWTGNKSEVPSPAIAVRTVNAGLQRFAAGYDIAREFLDISAGGPVIEAFIRKLVDSYSKVSDEYVLAQLVAAVGSTTAATAPPANVGAGWGKIVQGALKLVADDATPNFAVVAPDVHASLAYTREQDRLAFLSQGVGLTEGALTGIKVVVHKNLAAGQVLVGDSRAAKVFELPGAPVRVSALDLARGGVDEAVHGYVSVLTEYPKGLALITNAV